MTWLGSILKLEGQGGFAGILVVIAANHHKLFPTQAGHMTLFGVAGVCTVNSIMS